MRARSNSPYRLRRIFATVIGVGALVSIVVANPSSYEAIFADKNRISNGTDVDAGSSDEVAQSSPAANSGPLALEILEKLEIKGRAPKTGYSRDQFYSNWPNVDSCNLRQRILRRELGDSAQLASDLCTVISGEFTEPYTGQHLIFYTKSDLSTGLQIDHVVALSDAWQKGAQKLTSAERLALATDPLNLLAVDSAANQKKSDGDAATWLPPNKSFRCQYVARQVSVKYKYRLWVTQAEHDAVARVLATCPSEPALGVEE